MGGLYITDNIEKIGIGAFNGCTGMSTVSMADELTAKTDAEIFSDTQIDTGAMKKVAETTKTAQFGKIWCRKQKQLKWKSALKNTYGRRLSPPAHI